MYHHSGAFLSLGTGRNDGGSPLLSKATCGCVHVYTSLGNILHRVRPQPVLFQSKGRGLRRTHSQAGLTQERGMKGEGSAAQVASLRSQEAGCLETLSLNPSLSYRWTNQGPEGARVFP